MRKKLIEFDNAKEKMALGANKLARAVSCTLGPKGRNVVLYLEDGRMHTTKDGVTVALFTKFFDQIEDAGATFLQDASKKTVHQSGDGTTTCTLVANALIQQGVTYLKDKMHSAVEYTDGIQKASRNLIEELVQESIEINGDLDMIENVARISANNDAELGKIIREAIEAVGLDSIIQADDSGDNTTSVKVVDGMEFQNGFKHPYYINDHKGRCVFDDKSDKVKVIIIDNDLTTLKQVIMMMKHIGENNLKAVIVCNQMIGEADSVALVNVQNNGLKVCVVNAPGMGDRRRAYLRDLGIFTGATVIGDETGTEIENFKPEWMGTCEKFVADAKTSRFIMGGNVPDVVQGDIDSLKLKMVKPGPESSMEARANYTRQKQEVKDLYEKKKLITNEIGSIETQIGNTTDAFAIKKHKERIQRLKGKAAIILVGAQTTQELRQKKDRVDDAIKATQASVEEGIVPGGGVSFYNAMKRVTLNDPYAGDETPEQIGYYAFLDVMSEVLIKICENSGYDVASTIAKMEARKDMQFGLNAKSGEFCNLIDAGIINPTKVDRVAIENATSSACTMLLSECVIYPDPEAFEEVPQQ